MLFIFAWINTMAKKNTKVPNWEWPAICTWDKNFSFLKINLQFSVALTGGNGGGRLYFALMNSFGS